MKKTNPIYFFTSIDYDDSTPAGYDPEDYLGEYNAEIYYDFIDLKTKEEGTGVAFHNYPYFPADILVADDAVNVKKDGVGEYHIDYTVSYDTCVETLEEMVREGSSMSDITADELKKRITQGMQKTI